MHQPFSTSFARSVEIIVVHFPDADLWLTFKSQWRKSVMRILSSMGVVWYLVLLLIVSCIRFQFGLLLSIRLS